MRTLKDLKEWHDLQEKIARVIQTHTIMPDGRKFYQTQATHHQKASMLIQHAIDFIQGETEMP